MAHGVNIQIRSIKQAVLDVVLPSMKVIAWVVGIVAAMDGTTETAIFVRIRRKRILQIHQAVLVHLQIVGIQDMGRLRFLLTMEEADSVLYPYTEPVQAEEEVSV